MILVIEEKSDWVLLIRLTTDGRSVENSWHRTVDGAKQQAIFEFNDSLLDWELVPAEVEDTVSFGLSLRDQ